MFVRRYGSIFYTPSDNLFALLSTVLTLLSRFLLSTYRSGTNRVLFRNADHHACGRIESIYTVYYWCCTLDCSMFRAAIRVDV